MDTIAGEKGLAFKEPEKEIFRMSCRADMEIARQILEQKDEEIFRACDKAVCHSEGFRGTSIKTVYGTAGVSISAQGAGGMTYPRALGAGAVARPGERIVREEEASVDRMNAGNGGGSRIGEPNGP